MTLMRDRRRRQRGSVLSGLLVIVALLSILLGALMTELTSSFLLSRALVGRVTREATVTSAMELGISGLQTRARNHLVPANCARDSVAPVSLSLNGSPATVTQTTCSEIVPDAVTPIAQGSFAVDGSLATLSGNNRYLAVDASGRLYSYPIGLTAADWTASVGGPPTSSLLPMQSSHGKVVLVPTSMAGSGCGGHCVALLNLGASGVRCTMPASTTVTTSPAAEVDSQPNFPDYAFFAGSGGAGRLYVYDAASNGSCDQLASAALGGTAAGAPLVFPGDVSGGRRNSTVNDEIFALVTSSGSTSLQHWRYTETQQNCAGNDNCGSGGPDVSLSLVSTLALTTSVGGNAIGYAASSTAPTTNTPLKLAVVSASGRLAIAQIGVSSGPIYTMSSVATGALPGGVSRPPSWSAQNVIGVGSTNGTLYLLNPALAVLYTYDGQADGRPAINTTPRADSNGDWYFGASDGSLYDVEAPAAGKALVKAAKLALGGTLSSPVVGDVSQGCSPGTCVYLGSSSGGARFVQLGYTRVLELRACISASLGSTTCTANPRLWAKVEVGTAAVVGARGVLVQGWSYYAP
jgi:hypothetical protein